MRISTALLITVCTVLFFSTSFEALGQLVEPHFQVINLQNTCGPGNPTTGSFVVRIISVDPGATSLTISISSGTPLPDITVSPTPQDVLVTGLSGNPSGSKSYLVFLSDGVNSVVADNGANFRIFNFNPTLGTVTHNTDPNCTSPNGVITINATAVQVPPTLPTLPIVYSWVGPNGFTASTKDISGLKGGDYTLTYRDSNTPTATSCVIGPIHINDPTPPSFTITSPPTAATYSVCENQAFTLKVDPTDATYTYTVYEATTALSTSVAGNGSELTLNVPALSLGTHTLHVEAKRGSCPAVSNAGSNLTVQVNAVPVYAGTPVAAVCSDTATGVNLNTFKNVASIAASTFTIISITPQSGLTGPTTLPRSGGATLITGDQWVNKTNGSLSVDYVFEPSTPSCPGAQFTVTIPVSPQPDYNPYNNLTPGICSDDVIAVMDLDPLAKPSTLTATSYQLTAVSAVGLTASGGSSYGAFPVAISKTDLADDKWTNVQNGPRNVIYTIVPRVGTCAGDPFLVTVTINPEPLASLSNYTKTICSGDNVNFDLLASAIALGNNIPGTTFSWVVADNASVTGEAVGTQTTSTIGDVLVNKSTTSQPVVYDVTPKVGTCVGTLFKVTVTVNPEPVAPVGLNKTICSKDNVAFNLQTGAIDLGNGIAGSTFTWIATDNTNVTGESTTTQTTSSITDALVNVTNASQPVQYTVTPKSPANCVGAPFIVTINVNPEPFSPGGGKGICSGDAVNFNLQTLGVDFGNAVPSTYVWRAADNTSVTGESLTDQPGTTITDVLVNTTSSATNVDYTATPKSTDGCVGQPFAITVTVHPRPSYKDYNDDLVPSGICADPLGIDLDLQKNTGSILATTYDVVVTSHGAATPAGGSPALTLLTGRLANEIADDVWSNTTNANIIVTYSITPINQTCPGTPFNVNVTIKPQPAYTDGVDTACSGQQIVYDLNATQTSAGAATTFDVSFVPDAGVTPVANVTAGPGNSTSINDDVWQNTTGGPLKVIYTVIPRIGTCAGASFQVVVTIDPEPVYASPTPATICSQQLVGLDLSTLKSSPTGVTATTFDVTAVPDAGLTPVGPTQLTVTAGSATVIADDQWRNVSSGALHVNYTIIPKTAAGCAATTPISVSITVNPQPDYNDFTNAPAGICASPLGIDITSLKKSGSISATSFAITPHPDPDPLLTLVAGATTPNDLSDDVWQNLSGGALNVIYDIIPQVSAGCDGDVFHVTVKILPTPTYTDLTNTTPGVCSNVAIAVASLDALKTGSSAVADTYTVTNINIPAGLSFVGTLPATPFTVVSGDLANDVWKNTSTTFKDVIYTIKPRVGTCDGVDFKVTVRIHPEPVAPTDVPKTICSNNNVNVNLQTDAVDLGNALAGSSFSWTVADNTNVTGESTGTQTSTLINDPLVNTSAIDQPVVYTVIPKGPQGCAGAQFTVTITVSPRPVLLVPQSTTVCSGNAVGYAFVLTPANMPAGTTFSWQAAGNGNVTGESTTAQPGNTITDVLVNTVSAAEVVTYTVTPSLGSCTGTPQVVTVTVNRGYVANAGGDQTLCTDAGAYLLAGSSVSGAAIQGKWSIVTNPGDGLLSSTAFVSDPTTVTFTATQPGDYILKLETEVDPSGVCLPGADVVTITVTEKPVINPIPKTICGNEPASYSIQLSTTDLHSITRFSWPVPNDPTSGAANAQPSPPAGVAYVAPGTIHINDILSNETSADIDITYSVTPAAGLCVGAPKNIMITVRPSPVIAFNQTKTICSGDRVDHEILLSPANMPTDSKFSWPDPDGSGASKMNSATSRHDVLADPVGKFHITDTLYNDQPTQRTVTYQVIAQGANGCYSRVREVNILVNPGAIAEAGSAQSVCANGTIKLLGSSVGGLVTRGTWSIVSGPAGALITNGTNTTTPADAEFTATTGGTYRLRLTTEDPVSCPAVSDDVIITVKNVGDPSCTGGSGTCATVSIIPVPTPATCNNSDGSVFFNINPALPITGDVKITIDGTGSTTLPSPRTNFASIDGFTFDVLATGTYSYSIEYGDASCTKTGVFSIDRSGTVGIPVATNLVDPVCSGGTGSATIDAPGQTGSALQWSVDGITWTPFLGGGVVNGLPAGTNLIFVQRPGDACAGGVTVALADPTPIAATFTPTDATCNNNDGSIEVANLTGGTGPYTFIINGDPINLPANNIFGGLTADAYNIIITDSKSCFTTFNPVNISFPGFVNHTAPVTTAPDCIGGGANGKVEFTITDPGVFQFAITTDLVLEPTDYNTLGGSLVSIPNLTHGDYAVWLKPVGAGVKCSTKIPVSITGVYAVTYTASTSDVVCFAEPSAIVVDNITGAPALPFTYTLTNTSDNSVTTGTISASQALSAFSITGINKGNYSLLLTQDQSSLVACPSPITGGAKALLVSGPTGKLDSLYVKRGISVPDLPSGSALVGVQPSGLEPYETRLELTTPLFASQTFVSDWTETAVNPQNLKFEHSYTNLYAGIYTLGIRDAGGCEKTYVFALDVDTDLFIPNIFTPNGDGSNDVFYIRNLPADSKLLIANRWGKEVYKTSSYNNDWGGGDAVDGLYYYTLNLGGKSYTGWVEILRGQ